MPSMWMPPAAATGSRGASAELNWDLGSHTLTSISAYKDYFNAVNDAAPLRHQHQFGWL
jgi:hypothetical protein